MSEKPTGRDVIAGLVTGLFSIPEGMAYASIGGFNPIFGLYAGIVPTVLGSVLARTVLMVTTLTGAIALSSQSVLAEAGLDPTDPANVATLTVLVGIVMAAFGVLRLGVVMSFVSHAVMTGFTTGIALQIAVSVLGDVSAYDPSGGNQIGKLVDWLRHVGEWDGASVTVAAATVGVWVATRLVKPLAFLATLIALLVVTVIVGILGTDVATVGDIASVPSGLPRPVLPDLGVAPELIGGAFAVALVALAQAAGIGAAVPNPDGSRPNVNRDFLAQGIANLGGGLTRCLPTGGSLSRTGVATSAGAHTRWAGIFAGLWLAGIVVIAGRSAESIPMPVIGALLVVIGVELIVGKVGDISLVLRTSVLSAVAMVVTFLATTELALEKAIVLGAALSLLLYCAQASRQGHLVALSSDGPDRWRGGPVPEAIEPGTVTVLHYAGASFFAELGRIEEAWPRTDDAAGSVVILSLRTLPDVPSVTLLQTLARRAEELRSRGGRLLLAGVDGTLRRELERVPLIDAIGEENLFPAEPEIFAAVNKALAEAHRWIAQAGTPARSET